MNRISVYFVVVFLLIVLTSILIFSIGIPEESNLTSDDAGLTITGLTRESQDINITTLGSFLYQVDPAVGVLDEPLLLTFDLSSAQNRDFETAVYWYDKDILMWKEILGPIAPEVNTVAVERYELGLFSIREYADIQAPDFISTYDELLEMAPDNTVGYRLAVGFITDDGSAIQVPGTIQTGGCGGVVLNGNLTQMSQLENSARVFINDVDTEVDFIFIGLWFINDQSGCVDELRLEATRM